jgi:hypothetical protein
MLLAQFVYGVYTPLQRGGPALSVLLYDESAGRQELEEEIAKIHRNERCVQRAEGLMAVLSMLAVAGLVYPSILLENFPYNAPPLIMHLIYALGAGTLISLLAFAGLGMVYRKKLDRREEACRQAAARLLEAHPGQPDTTPLQFMPDSGVGVRNDGATHGAGGVNGSPLKTESSATG